MIDETGDAEHFCCEKGTESGGDLTWGSRLITTENFRRKGTVCTQLLVASTDKRETFADDQTLAFRHVRDALSRSIESDRGRELCMSHISPVCTCVCMYVCVIYTHVYVYTCVYLYVYV